MKLSTAQPGQVVRNTKNGSFYRFERIERSRARIFPLELFPTGLLLAKSTPTLVDGDIDVAVIGAWIEDMVVEGSPTHSRKVYEKELICEQIRLVELRVAYAELPPSGTGKFSRGSWANKVKNCAMRVDMLQRGLGFVPTTTATVTVESTALPLFARNQLVQVPSGRIAKVMKLVPMGDTTYARVATVFNGARVEASLPCEVLRSAQLSRLCSC